MELKPVPNTNVQPPAALPAAAVAAEQRLTERPVEPAARSEEARNRAPRGEDVVEIQSRRTELRVDEQTHRVYARVRDDRTGEVIRQIPTEESLAHQAKLREVLGDLIDELA